MKKVVISVIVLMISLMVFSANVEVRANVINNETESDNITANSNYTSVLNKWKNEGVVDNRDFLTVITPFDFIFDQGEYIEENSYDSFLSKEELLNHNGS